MKKTSEEIFVETLLELSEHMSVDKITVKMIVEKSGLSLQTFYNHYIDKADLIISVHKVKSDELLKKFESGKITYHEALMENIKFYYDHKNFFLNAIKNTSGQDSYTKMSIEESYRMSYDYILRKNHISNLNNEIDFYLRMYISGGVLMYAYWAEKMPETSVKELAHYLENAIPNKLKAYI
ncbi:TetR/AcrR family transcriptional regulator [uncultured Anaerococcus sp.]|uniref:TetR/AcrR family transcriptional regulator n=1 Tax=uncultured Anaerococcus sp. TaxID=293428 RepID=UPI0026270641|nr:TetR/AcrR family transcriptional regulator [uncultured Anaerococcus sp.]